MESSFYKLEDVPTNLQEIITELLAPIRDRQRVKKMIMNEVIIGICSLGYFSPNLLSKLTERSKDTIKEYLTELSSANRLKKLYELPNHPKQAYSKVQ